MKPWSSAARGISPTRSPYNTEFTPSISSQSKPPSGLDAGVKRDLQSIEKCVIYAEGANCSGSSWNRTHGRTPAIASLQTLSGKSAAHKLKMLRAVDKLKTVTALRLSGR